MSEKLGGGGKTGQIVALGGVSVFGAPYLHNAGMLTPKPIYILKALEKGFQNIHRFGGQSQLKEKLWPTHENWSTID